MQGAGGNMTIAYNTHILVDQYRKLLRVQRKGEGG